jgi:hypothetical protein
VLDTAVENLNILSEKPGSSGEKTDKNRNNMILADGENNTVVEVLGEWNIRGNEHVSADATDMLGDS